MGLTSLAPHPNAGLLFLEFTLSREGQEAVPESGLHTGALRRAASKPEIASGGERVEIAHRHARRGGKESEALGRFVPATVPVVAQRVPSGASLSLEDHCHSAEVLSLRDVREGIHFFENEINFRRMDSFPSRCCASLSRE
jgi:hypothetical protein